MASNSEFIPVENEGWLQGYRNLSRRELASWWKTRSWLTQALIWIAIIDGMLAMVLLMVPEIDKAQQKDATPSGEQQAAQDENLGLMMFFTMMGMAPAVGAVIAGQEAILDEKIKGTAGWLLSKPVSRSAFILSKITPNALGMLVTMAVLPGIVGYFIFLVAGHPVSILGFSAGILAAFLSLFFYLTFTIFLSTVSNSRGLAIGLPMGMIFGYQLFLGLVPGLANYTHWGLTVAVGSGSTPLAMALAQEQWNANFMPVVCTVLLILVFSFLAVRRFEKEEL
ncbi:MAG TPA: ABC transporter permease subunit [Anaerolineaceae bacterium]|nr:ABC transporter permease subunit [Anaerolineaceae bacterium]